MQSSIKIKNIYYMLAYAFEALQDVSFASIRPEEFDNIHDLLSAILVHGVRHQIKRGLCQEHLTHTNPLSHLKGKIDLSASIRDQTLQSRKMICHYGVCSADTLPNQILKTTLLALLRQKDVTLNTKKDIRRLIFYFSNIQTIDPLFINWRALKYHRHDKGYGILLNVCSFILHYLLPSERSGTRKFFHVEEAMEKFRLFEKFILKYYKKEHPYLRKVHAPHIKWGLDDGMPEMLPEMRTDIVLEQDGGTLIMDAKFYQNPLFLSYEGGRHKFCSAHLYQIFSYVKNMSCSHLGRVSGLLLYAQPEHCPAEAKQYNMSGNMIGVEFLNLNAEWSEIQDQLDKIPQTYLR